MIVQAKRIAKAQSRDSEGRSRLCLLMARVVAVLEAMPPRTPVTAIPLRCPKALTAK